MPTDEPPKHIPENIREAIEQIAETIPSLPSEEACHLKWPTRLEQSRDGMIVDGNRLVSDACVLCSAKLTATATAGGGYMACDSPSDDAARKLWLTQHDPAERLYPYGDRVLIRLDELAGFTEGKHGLKLYRPDRIADWTAAAVVIAVGPGARDPKTGIRKPIDDILPGDHVSLDWRPDHQTFDVEARAGKRVMIVETRELVGRWIDSDEYEAAREQRKIAAGVERFKAETQKQIFDHLITSDGSSSDTKQSTPCIHLSTSKWSDGKATCFGCGVELDDGSTVLRTSEGYARPHAYDSSVHTIEQIELSGQVGFESQYSQNPERIDDSDLDRLEGTTAEELDQIKKAWTTPIRGRINEGATVVAPDPRRVTMSFMGKPIEGAMTIEPCPECNDPLGNPGAPKRACDVVDLEPGDCPTCGRSEYVDRGHLGDGRCVTVGSFINGEQVMVSKPEEPVRIYAERVDGGGLIEVLLPMNCIVVMPKDDETVAEQIQHIVLNC